MRVPLLLLLLAAAPASAQMRLPAPQPPTSTNPPAFGIDAVSSGVRERAARLRAAVGVAFEKGLIGRDEAERLSLRVARMQQQLAWHEPRGYRERMRWRERLDAVQAELDRSMAGARG